MTDRFLSFRRVAVLAGVVAVLFAAPQLTAAQDAGTQGTGTQGTGAQDLTLLSDQPLSNQPVPLPAPRPNIAAPASPDSGGATGPAGTALGGAVQTGDIITNPIAVFAGLDQATGRIVSFEVLLDEPVPFAALQVTPKICNSRPPTAAPLTTGFVAVDEVMLNNQVRRIFSGWMFADSPSINAVEHSVYDVWLTDCRTAPGEAFVGN